MNNVTSQVYKKETVQQQKPWVIEDQKIEQTVPIPEYLEKVYWWAYVRPYAIRFFDRPGIIDLILLGNMNKLSGKALDELGDEIHGRTLQIASVYGDYIPKLARRLAEDGSLDVVDVVPAQLENLRRKLPINAPVRLIQNDASDIQLDDESYDQVVLFFLLHEMPEGLREKTLSGALRLLKPGGKLVIVDYHKPAAWNPLRYTLFPVIFKLLEPFAFDIWKHKIEEWLPRDFVPTDVKKETVFGGVYQKLVIHK